MSAGGETMAKITEDQDFISNLPCNVTDEILKRLPISMAAKLSILSKQWRRNWLSIKNLVFDEKFWNELGYDGSYAFVITSCIISNILFHHVGPVYEFHLYIPDCEEYLNYSQWLSLLSRIGVKKIVMLLKADYEPMPSYIFDCKDLVELKIEGFILNRVPSHFKGFAYLRSLELIDIDFKNDLFRSMTANCPRLAVLKLEQWTGMKRPVIDVPSLEHLTIVGKFETIVFKNVQHLSFLSLYLDKMKYGNVKAIGVDRSIEFLASSCQLQELQCGGYMCKYFAAARCITTSPKQLSLHRLRLTEVDLSDYDEFCFTIGMFQCCPLIKDLDISVKSKKCEVEHDFDYNENCKLGHLVKVKITGLTGSSPELKLIEYLLSTAAKLEKMAFKCKNLDLNSELKVARDLLQLPRASPKAKLVCLGK